MGEEQKPAKLSYEELEKYAMQVSEQAEYMQRELQKLSNTNVHQRMAYLFEVVKNATAFDSICVNACVDEIQNALQPNTVNDKSEKTNIKEHE